MIKKITIRLPKNESEKWSVSFWGKKHLKEKSALAIYRAIRSEFQARAKTQKIVVVVKMGRDTINESVPLQNRSSAVRVIRCFLEDYLEAKREESLK